MKQTNVINYKTEKEHKIESYRFKVLGTFANEPENKIATNTQTEQKPDELNLVKEDSQSQEENLTQKEYQPSFIEELLKRTDELSGNIIKLQMQIENQENEFKARLEEEKQRSKDEGLKEGEQTANAKFEILLNEIKNKYLISIQKIDEEKSKLENLYQKSEKELATTAIEIAKEVILKEVKDNSAIIALNIAKSLIKELNKASNIEIKVNIKDYEFLKENFKSISNIKISPDEAINSGGVILLSDIGNIDGGVLDRFNKIKKILSE